MKIPKSISLKSAIFQHFCLFSIWKVLTNPCRGHLNQQEKALSSKAFLLVILFFIPNFVPKSLYSQNKRVSSKDSLFISHSFSSKKPPRRWFISINRPSLRLWVGTWDKCAPGLWLYPYVPHVNQILLAPGCDQEDLVAYCQERDILIEAYSPLGTGGIFGNEDVEAVA